MHCASEWEMGDKWLRIWKTLLDKGKTVYKQLTFRTLRHNEWNSSLYSYNKFVVQDKNKIVAFPTCSNKWFFQSINSSSFLPLLLSPCTKQGPVPERMITTLIQDWIKILIHHSDHIFLHILTSFWVLISFYYQHHVLRLEVKEIPCKLFISMSWGLDKKTRGLKFGFLLSKPNLLLRTRGLFLESPDN